MYVPGFMHISSQNVSVPKRHTRATIVLFDSQVGLMTCTSGTASSGRSFVSIFFCFWPVHSIHSEGAGRRKQKVLQIRFSAS